MQTTHTYKIWLWYNIVKTVNDVGMDRTRRLLHRPIHCQDDKSSHTSSHRGMEKVWPVWYQFNIWKGPGLAKNIDIDHTLHLGSTVKKHHVYCFGGQLWIAACPPCWRVKTMLTNAWNSLIKQNICYHHFIFKVSTQSWPVQSFWKQPHCQNSRFSIYRLIDWNK